MWGAYAHLLQAVQDQSATLDLEDKKGRLIWVIICVLGILCLISVSTHLWNLMDKLMDKSIVMKLLPCTPFAIAMVLSVWESMIQDGKRKAWGYFSFVLYIWDNPVKKCQWCSFSREQCASNPTTKYCPHFFTVVFFFCIVGVFHRKIRGQQT